MTTQDDWLVQELDGWMPEQGRKSGTVVGWRLQETENPIGEKPTVSSTGTQTTEPWPDLLQTPKCHAQDQTCWGPWETCRQNQLRSYPKRFSGNQT